MSKPAYWIVHCAGLESRRFLQRRDARAYIQQLKQQGRNPSMRAVS